MFYVSTRKVGGLRFVKVGRFQASFCVTRHPYPIAEPIRLRGHLVAAAVGVALAFGAVTLERAAYAEAPASRLACFDAHGDETSGNDWKICRHVAAR